jgi:hypothetical protein
MQPGLTSIKCGALLPFSYTRCSSTGTFLSYTSELSKVSMAGELGRIIFFAKTRGVLAHGSVVGWGTMLQAGSWRVRFPMRSLHFNLPNLFRHIMALGSTQPLTEMSTRIFLEVKGGWPHRHMSRLSGKCWSLDVSQQNGPPRSVTGIALYASVSRLALTFSTSYEMVPGKLSQEVHHWPEHKDQTTLT